MTLREAAIYGADGHLVRRVSVVEDPHHPGAYIVGEDVQMEYGETLLLIDSNGHMWPLDQPG